MHASMHACRMHAKANQKNKLSLWFSDSWLLLIFSYLLRACEGKPRVNRGRDGEGLLKLGHTRKGMRKVLGGFRETWRLKKGVSVNKKQKTPAANLFSRKWGLGAAIHIKCNQMHILFISTPYRYQGGQFLLDCYCIDYWALHPIAHWGWRGSCASALEAKAKMVADSFAGTFADTFAQANSNPIATGNRQYIYVYMCIYIYTYRIIFVIYTLLLLGGSIILIAYWLPMPMPRTRPVSWP